MHSAGLFSPKDPAFSVSVGVAALILEGRPNQNNCLNSISAEDDGTADTLLVAEYSRGRNLIKDAAQRINQKLQQIRTYPGTSKEYVENSAVEIPVGSPSHHSGTDEYATAEKIFVNPKFRGTDYGSSVYHAKSNIPYIKPTRSLIKTVESWTESSIIYNGLEKIKMLHMRSPIKTGNVTKNSPVATSSDVPKKRATNAQGPVQGPHCEQFLKKIGLVKVDSDDTSDHKCEYLSDMCRLWQSNLSKITSILLKNECICIEVYLGPENHAILLEQWTVRTVERIDQPMMSLQSLCSAIRSQLYFSQITAWSDQLKNLPAPLSREVIDNPRIIKNPQQTKAKLDILFRIRSLNTDGCFIERPQIHQFPDAIITESLSVQVCLKSLPRLGKIPILCDTPVVPSLAKVAAALVDERKMSYCTEKGKHRCLCEEEESPIKEEAMDFLSPIVSTTHREKQLQKYKKRLMKRDKAKKREESDSDEGKQFSNDLSLSQKRRSTGTSNNKIIQTLVPNANTVGTQTEFVAMDCATSTVPKCSNCGNSMHLVCFDCDKSTVVNNNCSKPKHEVASEDKSELLLRAIERTGHAFILHQRGHNSDNQIINCDTFSMNNNNVNDSGIAVNTTICDLIHLTPDPQDHTIEHDCRLCKRQKTGHHVVGNHSSAIICSNADISNNHDKNVSLPHVSFFLKDGGNGTRGSEMSDDQCNCDVMGMRKSQFFMTHSSKINLIKLFEADPPFEKSISSPTVAESVFNVANASPGCSSTAVQKSNSAPTFNHAALSPRFWRLQGFNKRRSRHLSDRSSTSEEPLSDDETYNDSMTKSVSSKSLSKLRKNANFPLYNLCGTLEESLLQHRLPPKYQIMGFKVLLGASGSFCPTQLTVPAVSNFYELLGNSVTSPYVSEFTLPRKGYCIPRNGTIQVTLINPLGTVVRMFVVPYDFSDMPTTSVTFIRQRILARDDLGSPCTDITSFNNLSSKDQMRLLRYAIHLRFKTSRSGRLYLHTNVKMLILRRPDCDTAAAHAGNSILESPNDLNTITIVPESPRYSERIDK